MQALSNFGNLLSFKRNQWLPGSLPVLVPSPPNIPIRNMQGPKGSFQGLLSTFTAASSACIDFELVGAMFSEAKMLEM